MLFTAMHCDDLGYLSHSYVTGSQTVGRATLLGHRQPGELWEVKIRKINKFKFFDEW